MMNYKVPAPHKPLSAKAVSYKAGKLERGRLRLALFDAWDERCYWCKRQLPDTSYVQIDHILPQKGFESARQRFARPNSHSLHGVENLAPMCDGGKSCNQEKGNAVDKAAGAIYDALDDAAKKADKVTKSVLEMREAKGVESAVLKVLAENPRPAEKAIKKYGRLLAQRINSVDESLLEHFDTVRQLNTSVDRGFIPDFMLDEWTNEIDIVLSSDGRLAYRIAQRILDIDLDETLKEAIESLIGKLDQRISQKGAIYESVASSDFALVGPRHLPLDPLTVEFGNGQIMALCLNGRVQSEHNASFTVTNTDGRLRQGESTVSVDGNFVIEVVFGNIDDEPEIRIDIEGVDISRT